jgi:hypothetical protein
VRFPQIALTLVAVAALALGAASANSRPDRPTGDVSGRDAAGDVEAAGLTAAEQAAIDVVSVRATGKEGLGVLVTATFRGNFTGLIGRGNLKNAAAVLVLKGKDGGSAGVVSLGAGPKGTVLRRSRSTQVAAVRHGRQLTFLIAGPGWGDVASASVEVLLNPPPLGARTTAGRPSYTPPHIPDEGWLKLLGVTPADTSSVSDPMPLVLTKVQLLALHDELMKTVGFLELIELAYGTDPELQAWIAALNYFAFQVRLLSIAGTTLSPLAGTVAPQAGGVVIVARNNGSDLYDALRFVLAGGVHHTGARLVGALVGRCGPGNGPSDVLCTLDKPLSPGQSATVQISTDKPYPAGTGVQVLAKKVGEAAFAGPFAVGAPAGPCECVDVSVNVTGFAHGHVTNPRGPVSLKLFMNWTMTCTKGRGACAGQITVVPSGDLKIIGPPGGKVECAGGPNCPQQTKGRFTVSMTSVQDLHETPRNVPITAKIYCKSGASLVETRTAKLLLHFDANGFLNKGKSDLKG